MVWRKITDRVLRRDREQLREDKAVVKVFRKRYARFRKLLDANASLAEMMADLEEKLSGNSLFGLMYVRHTAQQSISLARRMAKSLDAMNPGKYAALEKRIDVIESELTAVVGQQEDCLGQCRRLILGFNEVNLSMVDWVGGKCANLGEMLNMAEIPVPRGFAVTVTAFQRFMAHEGLEKDVQKLLTRVKADNRDELSSILEELRARVESAPLPEELVQALDEAMRAVFGSEDIRLAVRSSAQSEDGSKSFAGQFLTELNVTRHKV